jgi:hypothetical protein
MCIIIIITIIIIIIIIITTCANHTPCVTQMACQAFSLYGMTQMMIKVKRAQLGKQQKAEAKAEASSAASGKSKSKKKN